MGKYVLKRIILMLINLFITTFIVFALVRMIPVSIASSSATEKAALIQHYTNIGCTFKYLSNGVIITVKGDWIPVQYFRYIYNIFQGDFGSSLNFSTISGSSEVFDIFMERVKVTLVLNVWSFVIAMPVGLILGILAALKKNKWQDNVISIVIMLFISVPSFVLALLMQYFLGFKLGLFSLTYDSGEPTSIIMPILALSFGPIASLTRYSRAELTEVLTNDFMLLARAKGLTRGQATVRHALRNSMVPVMPIIIYNFIYILAGSFYIEQVFSVPGIGQLMVKAINTTPPDYDVYVGMSIFYMVLSFGGNLIVDLMYGVVDPRIRMGGKK